MRIAWAPTPSLPNSIHPTPARESYLGSISRSVWHRKNRPTSIIKAHTTAASTCLVQNGAYGRSEINDKSRTTSA